MMYLLIPGTLFFLGLTIKIFYWAVNNGQFDDLNTEGHRILFDDDVSVGKTAPPEKTTASAALADETAAAEAASDSHAPDSVVTSSRP